MKKFKIILSLLLSLLIILSVAGCGKINENDKTGEDESNNGNENTVGENNTGSDAEKGIIDKIKEKGYVVWGTEPTFQPFEMMSGDEVIGVDAEIAKAIADKIGVELKIENVEFDALPNALKSKTIDFIAAGYTVTADREKDMLFTDKYFKAVQVIIVKEDNEEIKSFNDITGKKVGVQNATSGDFLSEDMGAEVERYNTAIEATLDLQSGNLDAVVVDNLPAQAIVEQNEGLKIITDESIEEEEYAIGVRKNDTELQEIINEVLGELIADGKIDQWVEDYSGLQ